MKKFFCFALIFLVSATANSYADKWQTVGTRAMGMGGAGVAVAYGTDAQYYNPALLANPDYNSNISLNVNAEIKTTDKVLTLIDKINQMVHQYKDVADKIANNDYASATDMMSIFDALIALQELNLKNIGAVAGVNAGLASKLGKLTVSVRSYGSSGIIPIIDKKNIGLVTPKNGLNINNFDSPDTDEKQDAANIIKETLDKFDLTDSVANLFNLSGISSQELANAIVNMTDASNSTVEEIKEMADTIAEDFPKMETLLKDLLSGNYKDNESQVLIDAGIFTEVSAGCGFQILEGLQVGGNIKYIQGQMGQAGIMILKDDQKVARAEWDAFKDTKASNQISFDLGAFLDISKFTGKDIFLNPKFGITARNINNPYFERPEKPSDSELKWIGDKYYLGNQLRAGLAINPIEKLTIACDLDLLKNKTFVEGFDSQELSLGVEYLLLNSRAVALPLRAGISKNISESKTDIEYTLGTGIHTFGFCFEIAAGMSSNTTVLDGNEIPSSASLALNLSYAY